MTRRLSITNAWLLMLTLLSLPYYAVTAEDSAPDELADFHVRIQPLLKKYCWECHSADTIEADIDLGSMHTIQDVQEQLETWIKIRNVLDTAQMPPQASPQPSESEQEQLRRWTRSFLKREARAHAGDPGPVALRRLSNAEYTYAIHDLTGIETLDPTREFPIDSAAGEGFTNVGSGQGMSPSLIQKYLDAAKEVSAHLVLLPDGLRFSRFTTQRDRTDQLLAQIQDFYRKFTADGGGSSVNLQGIRFETNQGGLLPVREYLAATLEERTSLTSGKQTIDAVAQQRGLNPRYLQTLWEALNTTSNESFLLSDFRERWRQTAPNDLDSLLIEIEQAQSALWKLNSIGHIGRKNGPKRWLEPVSPLTTHYDLRVPMAVAENVADHSFTLTAIPVGGSSSKQKILWKQPRIEFVGDNPPPPILLKDVQQRVAEVQQTIAAEALRTTEYLTALQQLRRGGKSLADIAEERRLHPDLLKNWSSFTGIGTPTTHQVTGHFTEKLTAVQGYEALNGWGRAQTPSLLTNRSPEPIEILTLTVPAGGVTVHPAPQTAAQISWKSPVDCIVSCEGLVADADNKCGNGAAWRVEHHALDGSTVIAQGVIENGSQQRWQVSDGIAMKTGDVISLIIDARDSNHVCDTTHVEWILTEIGGAQRIWNLSKEIVEDILSANPHSDSYGHADVWHFCAVDSVPPKNSSIPSGSALARWKTLVQSKFELDDDETKQATAILAAAVQSILTDAHAEPLTEADQKLKDLLLDWRGPFNWLSLPAGPMGQAIDAAAQDSAYGIDSSLFGNNADGNSISATDLCLPVHQQIKLQLPHQLARNAAFVATGQFYDSTATESAVQLRFLPGNTEPPAFSVSEPILVSAAPETRQWMESQLSEFRNLFPPALCYARIVPVDEVVTLTLFHREDDHLRRLMLDDQQAANLDRLWEEFYFVSEEPLKLVVAHEQLVEFATQDRPDLVTEFSPLKEPIRQRADAFRAQQQAAEPAHVAGVIQLAKRAWRRPLTKSEKQSLHEFYARLRAEEISHAEAIRLLFARVLTSPAFLFKLEEPSSGTQPGPVNDQELASRLSFFLWSSGPDEELLEAANAGQLYQNEILLKQTRRMLNDRRIRRLAVQFACQWLHVRDFDRNDDKNEALYPEFAELRDDMYEETVRFFEDMFRNNGSILDMIHADHTFVNNVLARHYGMPETSEAGWKRIDNVQQYGRGGILGMSTMLATQSGASRTSPILRGNWVYETLLGERLPRPPANVPQLPETLPTGLTARQLIEQHSSVAACAKCHAKIDPFGFALEQYDAIGRLRSFPADTKTTLPDGQVLEGIEGLRNYLQNDRRNDVIRQFCRKLLGYSLGREVQLSDELLLDKMQQELAAGEYRIQVAIEQIVNSPQFRNIRGEQSNAVKGK